MTMEGEGGGVGPFIAQCGESKHEGPMLRVLFLFVLDFGLLFKSFQ